MIGFIGCGGAGGNIADVASKFGFVSGVINFSQRDLDAVDVRYKLKLNGSEGVGKNREDAISLFQDQWEVATNFVKENFSHVDVIAVCFSASGGSGSGIAPILLDVLTNVMPDKVFISLVILPDMSEVTVSQMNTLKVFEELSKLNVAILPIDNQQIKTIYPSIGKNKLFEITNQKTVEILIKVMNYTEKHSKNGNFDKKDFLTVFNTPGIAVISELEITSLSQGIDLSVGGISKRIQESWKTSVFTPIEDDKVTRAGIIFDGQETLMEFINHETIFNTFSYGPPLDLFEGYYHESNGKVITILTGLTWCKKRLNDIERSLNEGKEKVDLVLAGQTSYQSNTSNDIMNKLRKQPEKKTSVMDILNKYKR